MVVINLLCAIELYCDFNYISFIPLKPFYFVNHNFVNIDNYHPLFYYDINGFKFIKFLIYYENDALETINIKLRSKPRNLVEFYYVPFRLSIIFILKLFYMRIYHCKYVVLYILIIMIS